MAVGFKSPPIVSEVGTDTNTDKVLGELWGWYRPLPPGGQPGWVNDLRTVRQTLHQSKKIENN